MSDFETITLGGLLSRLLAWGWIVVVAIVAIAVIRAIASPREDEGDELGGWDGEGMPGPLRREPGLGAEGEGD